MNTTAQLKLVYEAVIKKFKWLFKKKKKNLNKDVSSFPPDIQK